VIYQRAPAVSRLSLLITPIPVSTAMILTPLGPLLLAKVGLLLVVRRVELFHFRSDEVFPVAVLEEGDLRGLVDVRLWGQGYKTFLLVINSSAK